ncbi:hypothetical protein SmJEL517_g00551 [Synchytrium microbalum]|uniref:B box-type domain-containing protein n=1 Tax=Synchytrium microbalum TaxID=1806994 RepID=A0A507CDI8_9FUNG|nr:uncharacterized protein SmJEL517_g00551 [Synchytrium microbalum]TPX37682.1 hypothetical protein SmJEL517_g00551 [Synchytrium microbalum]
MDIDSPDEDVQVEVYSPVMDDSENEQFEHVEIPTIPASSTSNKTKFNLAEVLDGDADHILVDDKTALGSLGGYDTPDPDDEADEEERPPPEGFCVECEDQPANGVCDVCKDAYCEVCYQGQHRKGARRQHKLVLFAGVPASQSITKSTMPTPNINNNNSHASALPSLSAMNGAANGQGSKSPKAGWKFSFGFSQKNSAPDSDDDDIEDAADSGSEAPAPSISTRAPLLDEYVERSKYIPLRLEYGERKYVRLISAALDISEYTDKVDIQSYANKPKRIVAQIKELCQILSGLVVSADYKIGQELFSNRDFADNESFFQRIFELGRRHKVMNPDKMRSSYGKLMYMLMDSQIPEIQEMLEFNCVTPLQTVHGTLNAKTALNVLSDELMPVATEEINPENKSRYQIQADIKRKEKSIELLARKYGSADCSPEVIRTCLYSIGDNNAFLRQNRDPCDKMLYYLTKYFHAEKVEKNYSLAIQSGKGGARLTHNHTRQFNYVFQSLTLWSMVLHEFYKMWMMAELDLLDNQSMYRLRDTGQGLNRVQHAPRVGRMMNNILNAAQTKVGSWVGSSVVHLGDHNVPNAFIFIDKYTQICRILGPITLCIEKIGEIAKDPAIHTYIKNGYGSVDDCRKTILRDFFTHAFDGSGADNFFDAGSCIDGRLTSAWNWCSKIESKPYFYVMLLTGFVGFDAKTKTNHIRGECTLRLKELGRKPIPLIDVALTTSYQDVLAAQSISWAVRQVIRMITVVYTITDTETTLASTDVQGTTEHYTIDFEWAERHHPIFGNFKDRMKRLEDGSLYLEAVSEEYHWSTEGKWTLEEDGQLLVRSYHFKSPTLEKDLRLCYRKQP